MIIDMPNATSAQIAKRLVTAREEGGAVALGRVLTLIIVTDGEDDEQAIRAANEASAEHPMRVIVLELEPNATRARLDAEIRLGGDAGASEVIRLHATGVAAQQPETLVQALLLPDAPVAIWWTDEHPAVPSSDPLGAIAQRRITDVTEADRAEQVSELCDRFAAGDSDLAWTRLTAWRSLLASVFDQPPFEPVERVTVRGKPGAATTRLMAGWLALALGVRVNLIEELEEAIPGRLRSIEIERAESRITLDRISATEVELNQSGFPTQRLSLPLRDLTDLLAEELRSLAPDGVLGRVLREGLPLVRIHEPVEHENHD